MILFPKKTRTRKTEAKPKEAKPEAKSSWEYFLGDHGPEPEEVKCAEAAAVAALASKREQNTARWPSRCEPAEGGEIERLLLAGETAQAIAKHSEVFSSTGWCDQCERDLWNHDGSNPRDDHLLRLGNSCPQCVQCWCELWHCVECAPTAPKVCPEHHLKLETPAEHKAGSDAFTRICQEEEDAAKKRIAPS